MSHLAKLIKKPAAGLWQDYHGPGAKTLKISYETSKLSELWLEEVQGTKQFGKLKLLSGKAEAGVAPGSYFLLLRGKTSTPSEPFTIEITAPTEAKWKPEPPETSDPFANISELRAITING
jgi:hypothetical protein